MRPLKVTKSLQAYVKLNGVLTDGCPLYKLGIIASHWHQNMTRGNDFISCGNNLLSCGNDLLTCRNHLVSCGNGLLTCRNN